MGTTLEENPSVVDRFADCTIVVNAFLHLRPIETVSRALTINL
jgi:hypothetical protein